MTQKELSDFNYQLNKNYKTACRMGGSLMGMERLAYAATIAEYARPREGDISSTPDIGIVHLEQLKHSLDSTIWLLHGFQCTSLEDITGYVNNGGQILFRVKGRLATAPLGYKPEDVDCLNYVRTSLGMAPLIGEMPLAHGGE